MYMQEKHRCCVGQRGAKMRAEHFRKQKSPWFIVGRSTKWLAIVVTVLVFACGFDWSLSQRRHAAARMQSISSGDPDARAGTEPVFASKNILSPAVHATRLRRIVYPYSLIAGGIHSIEELKNAIANDPVVSTEYAGFHLANARIIRLDRERSMHVAYRFGDQVYWTKSELKLENGETLITDGEQTARTKCGNLITDAIVVQDSPNEPTAQALNTPISDPYTPTEVENVDEFPEIALAAYSDVPPVYSTVPPTGANYYSGGRTDTSVSLPSGPAGPSPYPAVPEASLVVRTPEPGTAILLLTALLALSYMQKRKRKDAPKIVT
jgi:hypothetical protein